MSVTKSIFLVFCIVGCAVPPADSPLTLEQELAREGKLRRLLLKATLEMKNADFHSLGRAEAALELARDLVPNDARVTDGLGCIEWRRGNIEMAEYLFKKAVEFNPEYDRAYAHLALIAESRGDIWAAIELFNIALRKNPLNYMARNNLGALLYERDELGAVDERLKRAKLEFLKVSEGMETTDAVIKQNLFLE